MAKAVYFKLGPKAQQFVDMITGFHVGKGEVGSFTPTRSRPLSKRIHEAVAGGHLQRVSEQEYNEYKGGKAVKPNELEQELDSLELSSCTADDLKKMSIKEIITFAKDSGFDEDDIETLNAIKKDHSDTKDKEKKAELFASLIYQFMELKDNYLEES